ncbi:hypothetical protein G5T42_10660 [Microbacterium sp. 4R-513]|nr:hypothetical protein G5T42_10660 [Microbacterium sp. 4R-513]
MPHLSALHLLLSFFGVAGGVDLSAVDSVTGALALAVALMSATLVLLSVVAVAHAAPGGASPPHPRRAIDASVLLAQSDPDAPGHPRPRAPQSAASAA